MHILRTNIRSSPSNPPHFFLYTPRMLSRVQSFLLQGIDAHPCEVEVHNNPQAMGESDGEGKSMIVGLPDTAVKESLERVRSALSNSGFIFPPGKTLVNLAPADVRKEGPLYDLPIAIGLLISLGIVGRKLDVQTRAASQRQMANTAAALSRSLPEKPLPPGARSTPLNDGVPDPREYLFAGELALDGRLRPVRGVLAMAALAQQKGYRGVIVPADNAAEASVVQGIEAIGVRTLAEVVGLLNGSLDIPPLQPIDVHTQLATAEAPVDFIDVRGQEAVKRAIVIAAAGSHNLLLV